MHWIPVDRVHCCFVARKNLIDYFVHTKISPAHSTSELFSSFQSMIVSPLLWARGSNNCLKQPAAFCCLCTDEFFRCFHDCPLSFGFPVMQTHMLEGYLYGSPASGLLYKIASIVFGLQVLSALSL
jgi:hypothetical protein